MPREKVLWVREPYLGQILAGRKTVEVRVAYSNIARLEVGDVLLLNGRHRVRIRRIGRYADFARMLEHEDPAAIAPDTPADDLLAAIRAIYPPEKEALGAVALEVEAAMAQKVPGAAEPGEPAGAGRPSCDTEPPAPA